MVARSENKLKRIAQEINKGDGSASYYVADLSNLSTVRNVATRILESEGTPDIIMNNAGGGQWKFANDQKNVLLNDHLSKNAHAEL